MTKESLDAMAFAAGQAAGLIPTDPPRAPIDVLDVLSRHKRFMYHLMDETESKIHLLKRALETRWQRRRDWLAAGCPPLTVAPCVDGGAAVSRGAAGREPVGVEAAGPSGAVSASGHEGVAPGAGAATGVGEREQEEGIADSDAVAGAGPVATSRGAGTDGRGVSASGPAWPTNREEEPDVGQGRPEGGSGGADGGDAERAGRGVDWPQPVPGASAALSAPMVNVAPVVFELPEASTVPAVPVTPASLVAPVASFSTMTRGRPRAAAEAAAAAMRATTVDGEELPPSAHSHGYPTIRLLSASRAAGTVGLPVSWGPLLADNRAAAKRADKPLQRMTLAHADLKGVGAPALPPRGTSTVTVPRATNAAVRVVLAAVYWSEHRKIDGRPVVAAQAGGEGRSQETATVAAGVRVGLSGTRETTPASTALLMPGQPGAAFPDRRSTSAARPVSSVLLGASRLPALPAMAATAAGDEDGHAPDLVRLCCLLTPRERGHSVAVAGAPAKLPSLSHRGGASGRHRALHTLRAAAASPSQARGRGGSGGSGGSGGGHGSSGDTGSSGSRSGRGDSTTASSSGLHHTRSPSDGVERWVANTASIPPVDQPGVLRFAGGGVLLDDPLATYEMAKEVNPWSKAERLVFLEKYVAHSKNFPRIASFLKRKSLADVVSFYYTNKLRLNLKSLAKSCAMKRRGGRKAALLRLASETRPRRAMGHNFWGGSAPRLAVLAAAAQDGAHGSRGLARDQHESGSGGSPASHTSTTGVSAGAAASAPWPEEDLVQLVHGMARHADDAGLADGPPSPIRVAGVPTEVVSPWANIAKAVGRGRSAMDCWEAYRRYRVALCLDAFASRRPPSFPLPREGMTDKQGALESCGAEEGGAVAAGVAGGAGAVGSRDASRAASLALTGQEEDAAAAPRDASPIEAIMGAAVTGVVAPSCRGGRSLRVGGRVGMPSGYYYEGGQVAPAGPVSPPRPGGAGVTAPVVLYGYDQRLHGPPAGGSADERRGRSAATGGGRRGSGWRGGRTATPLGPVRSPRIEHQRLGAGGGAGIAASDEAEDSVAVQPLVGDGNNGADHNPVGLSATDDVGATVRPLVSVLGGGRRAPPPPATADATVDVTIPSAPSRWPPKATRGRVRSRRQAGARGRMSASDALPLSPAGTLARAASIPPSEMAFVPPAVAKAVSPVVAAAAEVSPSLATRALRAVVASTTVAKAISSRPSTAAPTLATLAVRDAQAAALPAAPPATGRTSDPSVPFPVGAAISVTAPSPPHGPAWTAMLQSHLSSDEGQVLSLAQPPALAPAVAPPVVGGVPAAALEQLPMNPPAPPTSGFFPPTGPAVSPDPSASPVPSTPPVAPLAMLRPPSLAPPRPPRAMVGLPVRFPPPPANWAAEVVSRFRVLLAKHGSNWRIICQQLPNVLPSEVLSHTLAHYELPVTAVVAQPGRVDEHAVHEVQPVPSEMQPVPPVQLPLLRQEQQVPLVQPVRPAVQPVHPEQPVQPAVSPVLPMLRPAGSPFPSVVQPVRPAPSVVRPFQPVQPAVEPVRPVQLMQPVSPVQPTEPVVQPARLVQPVQLGQYLQPVQPGQHLQPALPAVRPVQPVQPTERVVQPAWRVQPVQPVRPVQPMQLAWPVQELQSSMRPVQGVWPAHPVVLPVQPPVQPTSQAQRARTVQPVQRSQLAVQPVEPVQPVQPVHPVEPLPVQPVLPPQLVAQQPFVVIDLEGEMDGTPEGGNAGRESAEPRPPSWASGGAGEE